MPRRRPPPSSLLAVLAGTITAAAVYALFPFPTTIPLFVGFAVGLAAWTVAEWTRLLLGLWRGHNEDARDPSYRPVDGSDEEWESASSYSSLVGDEPPATHVNSTAASTRCPSRSNTPSLRLPTVGDPVAASTTKPSFRPRLPRRLGLALATLLILYWSAVLGLVPPRRDEVVPWRVVDGSSSSQQTGATAAGYSNSTIGNGNSTAAAGDTGNGGRIFIAANLYNVERVWERWSREVIKLGEYFGPENVFLSIYESNSHDSTPDLLLTFGHTLTTLNIPHRIISERTTTRHWPYNSSPERIAYLASARNKALEPLASPDPDVRLPNTPAFARGTVVFLNDVVFAWRDVVELVRTRMHDGQEEGYDLACAMDFGWSGFYDTFVSRDICGVPMRPYYPYVKDPVSVEKMRKHEVMEVGACWNGIVAFRGDLVAYRSPEGTQVGTDNVDTLDVKNRTIQKRGWQMIDNTTDPRSRYSPSLQLPLAFRTSELDACDHSECFLFSYDLHRMYPTRERPPRIWMNPRVKVAYEQRWWTWHNVVLEVPVIKWWLDHVSRGYPLKLVDWLWESAGRRRDYCTWAGLQIPDRCPALPGAGIQTWDQG